jgi:hypothetical protein
MLPLLPNLLVISFPVDWLNTYITNNEALKAYELGRMGIVLIALGFYFYASEMDFNFRKKKSNKRAMWRVYDFIAFLSHRFTVLEHIWAMRSSWVDQGISEQLRVQENLCFSL